MVRPRAVLATQLAALVPFLVSITGGRLRFPAYRVDLDVYRLGAVVLLHGGDLYGTLPLTQDGQRLPFTYPPFAAIVLTPLALVPYWLASIVLPVLTVVLLAVVLKVTLRSVAGPTVVGTGLLLAEAIEPVRAALFAGQIDVLLMALVVLDVLVDTPRWPRGALVGVAAAMKLTPAVFVLYFLLRRDHRAAATAGVSFVASTGIGFLLAGADSRRYWSGVAFDATRVGNPWYAANQSLLGMLTRFGLPSAERTGSWLVLVVATIVVTVLGMRRALAAGQRAVALGCNACCGLLVSPISWSHHWVWAVVMLPGWAVAGWRAGRWLPLGLAGGGLLLFLASPQWWWPHGGTAEYHWSLLQQVTGSGYVCFGAVLLLTAATFRWVAPENTWRGSQLWRPLTANSQMRSLG